MQINRMEKLVELVDALETIRGRKKLQKIVHLLGTKGVRAFTYKFTLHHYGPYSRSLAAEIDFLVQGKILEEQRSNETYEYTVSELACEAGFAPKSRARTGWKAKANEWGKRDVRDLEALSTYVYLQRAGFTGEKQKKRFKIAKPHLLNRLELVKKEAKREGLLK